MKVVIICIICISFFFFLLIVSLVTSTLTCASNQDYIRVSKTSTSWASEESFKIYANSQVVRESDTFVNSSTQEFEYCISGGTNSQYTLELNDSFGDSWTSGSHITFFGLYNNAFFKGYIVASRTESYSLSLYYPIHQSSEWRVKSGSADSGWTSYSFNDQSWTLATLGITPVQVSGTQYFRKTFTGLSGMAAYELAMKYRYGIVVYINGIEVYRDNMAEGPVQSSTLAEGSYTTLSYHNILRPGAEVATAQSVLAIELHFLTAAGQSLVDFDSWMALYTPSALGTNCYVYAGQVSLSSSSGTNPTYAFDFTKGNSYYMSSLPSTLTYSFNGPKPYINGLRVWPYTSVTTAPTAFSFDGTMGSGTSSSSWTTVINVSSASYVSSQYSVFYGYFSAKNYNAYRAQITGSSYTYSYLYEMQPMVCSVVLPSGIQYPETSYSVYAKYENADITPVVTEWVGCTINPSLPQGLTIDSSCRITGKAETASPLTQYQVTSTMNGQQYQGTVSIQVTACTGTLVQVLRTYQSNAVNEDFTIRDATTNQVVMSVELNSGQQNYVNWIGIACLTGTKYTVTVHSSSNYWMSTSFLYVNAMLSGDEYETILRAKYDVNLALPTSYTFNTQYTVAAQTQWYYKMGEVPDNWKSSDVSGWQQASAGTYPSSTNRIQLYKRIITVGSLTEVAGFVLSLRYKYGCVVYINGNEVFRNAVNGDVTAQSQATSAYSDVKYRMISLPVRTMQIGEVQSVDYLQTGSNTIAIAIIAIDPSQTTSDFDCAVRLMGTSSVSRVFDYTTSYSYIYGSPSSIMNFYYGYTVYYSTCQTNLFQITFNDDRREWISSIEIQLHYLQSTQQVRQFVVKGRNSNSDEWTTLATVQGLNWSLAGQSKKIWLTNNNPYNQYRFENFATGSTSECYWKFSRLDLFSDATAVEVPALSYTSNISVYKDIEMAEVYPSSSYYTGFTIQPQLPAGLTLDPFSGMLSGTATSVTSAPTTYTITAQKFTGGSQSTTVTISVAICTGGKSLITLVARTDSYPQQASYKLYRGKQATGEPVSQNDRFRASSSLNYADFCVEHDIYNLQILDSGNNGWYNPAGYYLTVDLGEMRFEMGQMPSTVSSKTVLFSSLLPFQIEYDDWKLYNDIVNVDPNWNKVDFDDSAWLVRKASAIGISEATTVYVRRSVTIPDINDYQVLNVRVRYAGGIAAYFNNRLVARFNLEDNFDSSSTSIAIHDSNTFSKFHVILPTAGGVTGNNVIAFEIHRPLGQSSSTVIEFDATGVFGVMDCSIVVDTYTDVDGSTAYIVSNLESFLDLSPVTYGYVSNVVGSNIKWTVENLEGSKFNSFAMQTVYARTSFGFSVYGRMSDEDDEVSMIALVDQSTLALDRTAWDIPVGIAGFKHYKWEIDDTASSTVYFSSFITQYCKATGTICEAMGDYPAVSSGQISPSTCATGYRGYSYRECVGTTFSDVKTDKCVQKLPAKLNYQKNRYVFVMGTAVTTDTPTYLNIIEEFYLASNTFLPDGLELDPSTGRIHGTPTVEMGLMAYTIYGKNKVGATMTAINIQVRKGECPAEGNFVKTPVGEIAVYDCALQGSYVGSQKRACILGSVDGEWQKASGFCMPIVGIVIIVIVVIIIVAIVAFLVIRTSSRAKAVGGVKGKAGSKKASSSRKNLDRKPSTKAVKV